MNFKEYCHPMQRGIFWHSQWRHTTILNVTFSLIKSFRTSCIHLHSFLECVLSFFFANDCSQLKPSPQSGLWRQAKEASRTKGRIQKAFWNCRRTSCRTWSCPLWNLPLWSRHGSFCSFRKGHSFGGFQPEEQRVHSRSGSRCFGRKRDWIKIGLRFWRCSSVVN